MAPGKYYSKNNKRKTPIRTGVTFGRLKNEANNKVDLALSKTRSNNRLNKELTEYELARKIKGSIRSTLFRLPDEVGAGRLPKKESIAVASTALVIIFVIGRNKLLNHNLALKVKEGNLHTGWVRERKITWHTGRIERKKGGMVTISGVEEGPYGPFICPGGVMNKTATAGGLANCGIRKLKGRIRLSKMLIDGSPRAVRDGRRRCSMTSRTAKQGAGQYSTSNGRSNMPRTAPPTPGQITATRTILLKKGVPINKRLKSVSKLLLEVENRVYCNENAARKARSMLNVVGTLLQEMMTQLETADKEGDGYSYVLYDFGEFTWGRGPCSPYIKESRKFKNEDTNYCRYFSYLTRSFCKCRGCFIIY